MNMRRRELIISAIIILLVAGTFAVSFFVRPSTSEAQKVPYYFSGGGGNNVTPPSISIELCNTLFDPKLPISVGGVGWGAFATNVYVDSYVPGKVGIGIGPNGLDRSDPYHAIEFKQGGLDVIVQPVVTDAGLSWILKKGTAEHCPAPKAP